MRQRLESLETLIQQVRIDACQRVAEVVLVHLKESGFTTYEFLDGLSGVFHGKNHDKTIYHLEQAAMAERHESESFDSRKPESFQE